MKRLLILLPPIVLVVVAGLFLLGIGLIPYLFFGCLVASLIFYLRSRKQPMKRSDWMTFGIIVGVILGICLVAPLLLSFVYL